MEVPLTPLEFARRARSLYGNREAVVDGGLHLSYEEFFDLLHGRHGWTAGFRSKSVYCVAASAK